MIPYGRQEVKDRDIEAVVEVLKSDFLTQGPTVPRFEEFIARRVEAEHAVAVNSATSALHIACLALELGPGDVLWTVPNTFVASANSALYCGASVDFVDIDPRTGNMDVEALRSKLIDADRVGPVPKVIVPVHFAGQPTEQELIWELAQHYGFKILEDASHAIGASRQGEAVGNCRWSDIVVFSFHPVKIITTGEGGMALTNDPVLAERMATLRLHGITRDPELFVHAPSPDRSLPPWYYEQQMLGYNYRMTDIHAALGTSQLRRLDEYVTRRNALARRYDELLEELPVQVPLVLPRNRSAFHLYVVHLVDASPDRHQMVFEELRALGIGVNVHYIPVHLQPYYRRFGFRAGQFPVAEAHSTSAMSLPLFASLTDGQQDQVVSSLKQVLED